jgi:hypothetical protein
VRVTGIRLSDDLTAPLDAVTETFAIISKRRVGKSNVAVVMAEQMTDAGIPWVAIDPKGDWWGVRSSADGKHEGLPVVVFGGEHGDVPLEPGAGAYMADLVAERRLTCVLDVSEFSKADEVGFLRPFAERLLKVNRQPLHLFLEECDDYIPQEKATDELKLVRAFSRLIRHGGFKGIGATLITQRAALVNKNVLAQTETMIVLRTTHPPDQKQVADWIKGHEASAEVMPTLRSLPIGQGWVLSPGFLGTVSQHAFDRRRTFDSGATPKMGETRVEPSRLADVDLATIKEQMAETIEKAKADDPKELRKTIAEQRQRMGSYEVRLNELELELASRPDVEPERVEVPALAPDVADQLGALLTDLIDTASSIEQAGLATRDALDDAVAKFDAADVATQRLPAAAKEGSATGGRSSARPSPQSPPAVSTTGHTSRGTATPQVAPGRGGQEMRPAAPTGTAVDASLSDPQQRILDVLAWFTNLGIGPTVARSQVALYSGVSPKSGSYGQNLGVLRAAGYITYPSKGSVHVTDAGLAAAQPADAVTTTEELHEALLSRLPDPQAKIVKVLVAAYPEDCDRSDVAEACGVSPASGSYGQNLGVLRSLGLIDYPVKGRVTALPLLFID